MRRSRLLRLVSAVSSRVFLSDVDCYIDPAVDVTAQTVFISNHVCTLDSWVLLGRLEATFGRAISMVASDRVVKLVPVIRRRLIAVDGSPAGTLRAVQSVRQAASSGENLLLFPEGTHYSSCDMLGPFRPGAVHFLRAFGADRQVVTVGLAYYAYRKPKLALSIHMSRASIADNGSEAVDAVARLRETVQNDIEMAVARARLTYRARIKYAMQDWWSGDRAESERV